MGYKIQMIAAVMCLAAGWQSPPAPTPRVAVQLVRAVVEGRAEVGARAVGEFQRTSVVIEIGAGAVVLAARPNGTGDVSTDDQAILVVERPDGTKTTWSHDFRTAGSGVIEPVAPQNVSALFARGLHTVTLALVDLAPPLYSSSAYFLVYAAAAPPTPVNNAPTVPTPVVMQASSTPVVRLSTATVFATVAATPQATTMPAVTATAVTATAVTATAVTATAVMATQAAAEEGAGTATASVAGGVIGAGVVSIVAAAIVAGVLRRRGAIPPDALSGIAGLYNAGSNERLDGVDLTQFRGRVTVCMAPLRFADRRDRGTPVATLYRNERGMQCQIGSQADAAPVALHDLDEVRISAQVTLIYRSAQPSAMWVERGTL